MRPLAGHRALVSGAAGDIGRAICQRLAADGAEVVGFDLASRDGVLQVDACDESAVAGLVRRVKPTIAVPAAAIVEPGSPLAMNPDAWRRTMDINLTAAAFLARHAALSLIDQGSPGRIIFIGSWAAERPDPKIAAYCAAKAGLRMLMKCLAAECASRGILVNEVAPGYVDAGLSAGLFRENPGLREECLQRVPTRRLITAEDVAGVVSWLCTPEASHLSGSVITMDGGLSL